MSLPITLRQLEIFSEIARRGSLAGAGRALRLGEPAISEALRELEQRLGCALFDRTGWKLKLNSAGRAFKADAGRVLAETEDLVRRYSGREHLTLGASVTVGNYILPDLLIAFRSNEPRLELTVLIRNTESIVQAVMLREIEAGIVEGDVSHPELEVRPWRFDEQVIVAAAGHRLAGATDIGQLGREPWVLREPGSGTRQVFDAAAATWSFSPNVAMTVGGNELLKRAVCAGVGLGCLSHAAVREEVRRGDLILIRPRGIAMERMLRLVRIPGRAEQPALRRFLECCESVKEPQRAPQAERSASGKKGLAPNAGQ